jgi:hypothetical protein
MASRGCGETLVRARDWSLACSFSEEAAVCSQYFFSAFPVYNCCIVNSSFRVDRERL